MPKVSYAVQKEFKKGLLVGKKELVATNATKSVSNNNDHDKEKYFFKLRGRNINGFLLTNNKDISTKSEIQRNRVELRSFRKRKMADRGENNTAHSRRKMAKLDMADNIQQKIDDQIRMREGAMKLMSACSTLNQALETSKNLLTINARILGLMSALQKKKKQRVLEEYNKQRSSACSESPVDACTGRVAISDIRIPLMWKDNVHFTGKTGDQSYYAFALIRCGDQVRDTPLCEVTSADTDMYFDQSLLFEKLSADFKMDFEVYYTVISNHEAHGTKTPIRTPMNLRTYKKSVQFKAPKFCLAGHAQLTVDDIQKGILSMDLGMGGKGASGVAVLGDIHEFPIHPMELWGQMCCQLAAQPQCMLEETITGYCHVQIDNQWVKYYCKLYQSAISCWLDEAHSRNTKPAYVMSFTNVMKVSQVDFTDDKPDFIIHIISATSETLHSLKFEDNTTCLKWNYEMKQAVTNFRAWKQACNELMFIQEVKKRRLSLPSTASFYDQIKTTDVNNSSITKRSFNGNKVRPALDNIDENTERGKTAKTEKVSDDFLVTSMNSPCEIVPPLQNQPAPNLDQKDQLPEQATPSTPVLNQAATTPSIQETTSSQITTETSEITTGNAAVPEHNETLNIESNTNIIEAEDLTHKELSNIKIDDEPNIEHSKVASPNTPCDISMSVGSGADEIKMNDDNGDTPSNADVVPVMEDQEDNMGDELVNDKGSEPQMESEKVRNVEADSESHEDYDKSISTSDEYHETTTKDEDDTSKLESLSDNNTTCEIPDRLSSEHESFEVKENIDPTLNNVNIEDVVFPSTQPEIVNSVNEKDNVNEEANVDKFSPVNYTANDILTEKIDSQQIGEADNAETSDEILPPISKQPVEKDIQENVVNTNNLSANVTDDVMDLNQEKEVTQQVASDISKTGEDDDVASDIPKTEVDDDVASDIRKTEKDDLASDIPKTEKDDVASDIPKTEEDDVASDIPKTEEDDVASDILKTKEDDDVCLKDTVLKNKSVECDSPKNSEDEKNLNEIPTERSEKVKEQKDSLVEGPLCVKEHNDMNTSKDVEIHHKDLSEITKAAEDLEEKSADDPEPVKESHDNPKEDLNEISHNTSTNDESKSEAGLTIVGQNVTPEKERENKINELNDSLKCDKGMEERDSIDGSQEGECTVLEDEKNRKRKLEKQASLSKVQTTV